MTEERKGQIAYVLLKEKIAQEGIHLKPELNRDLGNLSKRTGIDLEELKSFAGILIDDMKESILGSR